MKQVINVKAIKKESNNKNYFDKETINCLLKSEDDIENGRTRKMADVVKEFEEKYGIWKLFIRHRIYRRMHWRNGRNLHLYLSKIKSN